MRRGYLGWTAPVAVLAAAAAIAPIALAAKGDVILVSRASNDGAGGTDSSFQSDISASGRFVAFRSLANNLVAGENEGVDNIFVYDRKTRDMELVSRPTQVGGPVANGSSFSPSISADGRFVAFQSDASNLAGSDGNGVGDVFLRDRKTGKTRLVSRRGNGDSGDGSSGDPSISADGRMIAFSSDADDLTGPGDDLVENVLVHDRRTGKTRLASRKSGGPEANGDSENPSISASGRYVAFDSDAANLSGGDVDGGVNDVFIHDRERGKTALVSRAGESGPGGDDDSEDPSVSADGRFIAFESQADNLSGSDAGPDVDDVFVRDRNRKRTRLLSVAPNGDPGDAESFSASISNSGRYVAFLSRALNLDTPNSGVQDIYVHDRRKGKIKIVSGEPDGDPADDDSRLPEISASGRFVTFSSDATDLSNDDSGLEDVFRVDYLGP